MKGKKRRTKGVLSSLGKVPKESKKKKAEPLGRKILKWAGGIVLGIVLVVLFIGNGTRLFRSSVGDQDMVETVTVDRIERDRQTAEGGAGASAMVRLMRQEVPIALSEAQLEEVAVGTEIKVIYNYVALTEEIDIIRWVVVPPDEEATGADPGDATSP